MVWRVVRKVPSLLAFAMLALAGPAAAEELVHGTAVAESGDRLRLETLRGSIEIRLQGLAAPPPGTTCPSAAGKRSRWNCGDGSREALAARIRGEDVVCRLVGREAGGAALAECAVQSHNLNLWMLATGRAILRKGWRGRIRAYDEAEMIARRAGAMLWHGMEPVEDR